MSNLPEVATSPGGLEVDHTAEIPNLHYTAQHQYVEQPQEVHSKGEYAPVNGEDRVVQPPPSPPLICGVRRSTFWLAVILAIVVIAAAVGGGVGGSIAVSNAKSNIQAANSPTPARETVTVTDAACTDSGGPAPTSTSDSDPPYIPKSPKYILSIVNSCPSSTIQSSDMGSGQKDKYNCQNGTDFGGNDIVWFTAYTLQDCIDACSSYNVGNKTTVPCKGVSLASDMSHQWNVNHGANCWLKMNIDRNGFSKSNTVTLAWLTDS